MDVGLRERGKRGAGPLLPSFWNHLQDGPKVAHRSPGSRPASVPGLDPGTEGEGVRVTTAEIYSLEFSRCHTSVNFLVSVKFCGYARCEHWRKPGKGVWELSALSLQLFWKSEIIFKIKS